MNEIIIKEYDSGDRSECIKLLMDTFPGSSSEATFAWRFEARNRLKPILICAKHKNEVVSFNSWLPWKFCYDNREYFGYQSGESATKLRYRGKGLFSKVLTYGQEIAKTRNVDFIFGFPSAMSYGAFYRNGYVPVSTNCFYLKIVNPLRIYKGPSFSIENNYPFQSMLTNENIITPKVDYEYIKWRYFDNPKKYEIIEYAENNCKAVFIFKIRTWKIFKEAILVDAQFNNFNEKFIEKSFAFIDKNLSRKVIYIRTLFNEYTDRGRMIRKFFLRKISLKYYVLIVKPISTKISKNVLLNANCWDIMPHCIDEL